MRYFLLFAFLLLSCLGRGQDYYNKSPEFLKRNSTWAFGRNAGYNAVTGTPLRMPLNSDEACGSVTDPNSGELLFFSDGLSCWNNKGILMSGSILGALKGNTTTAQGVCIVPFINDPTQYYLFTLQEQGGYSSSTSRGKLFYSVVDMKLNNGLGNVDTLRRAIVVDSFLGEMMIAVPGNNCDVWLLTHTTDSAVFKAFHITEDGVDPVPISSKAGGQIAGNAVYTLFAPTKWGAYAIGNMAISSDRSKLAITSRIGNLGTLVSEEGLAEGALVCEFDAHTGKVSGGFLLDSTGCYGVAFSPDNSKLYVASTDKAFTTMINQYDLNTFTEGAIKGSRTNLKIAYQSLYGLKLYNDTIYIPYGVGSTGAQPVLHRINKPNLAGTACDLQDNAITLFANTASFYSLPNDVVSALPPEISFHRSLDTTLCAPLGAFPDMALSAAEGYESYLWSDGHTGATYTINQPGVYWVSGSRGCHSRTDTFVLNQVNFSKPIINVNINELGTTIPYDKYQWILDDEAIAGANSRFYTIKANGNYKVVTGNGICSDTSEAYPINNVGIKEVGENLYGIQVYPNPAQGILQLKASVAVTAAMYTIEGRLIRGGLTAGPIDLSDMAPGVYWFHVYDTKGALLKVEKIVRQ